MSDMEHRLTDLLARAAPEAGGVAFADIVALRRRRRRVRLSGVVTVFLVVAVAVSGALVRGHVHRAVTPPVGHRLAGTVPWIATPGRGTLPGATRTPPPVNARPCTTADVSARVAPTGDLRGVNGGFVGTLVTFRNVSPSACVLTGYPHTRATEPGRRDVTARTGSVYQLSTDVSENMNSGASTQLIVETGRYCDANPGGGAAAVPYRHLAIDLPGGGTTHLTTGGTRALNLVCGLRVSRFFVRQPDQAEAISPVAGLRVRLRLPATVRAGTTLEYVAELDNTTTGPISLHPCPSYTQIARTTVPIAKNPYLLNCTSVSAIAAHQSVRFAMTLRVPATAAPGRAVVDWLLVDAPSHAAHATITIIRPH